MRDRMLVGLGVVFFQQVLYFLWAKSFTSQRIIFPWSLKARSNKRFFAVIFSFWWMWTNGLKTNVLSAYFLAWTFVTGLLVHIRQKEKIALEFARVNGPSRLYRLVYRSAECSVLCTVHFWKYWISFTFCSYFSDCGNWLHESEFV